MDSLDSQSKVYVILFLMMLFMILQMAIKRKKALQKTRFPFMVNAFKADYSVLNSLKVMYFISYEGVTFEIHPMIPNDIHEYLTEQELNKKFNERKSSSYYTMVKLKSEGHDMNQLIKEFSLKFNIVKLENKIDGSNELYIKDAFTQFNLDRITRFLGNYLKSIIVPIIKDDMAVNQPSDNEVNLLQ